MSTIDIESKVEGEQPASNSVALRDKGGAVGRAMSLDELHENLAFIRAVMAKEMKEGADYGKIPGCGDKPGLFQPGAQKLLMTFQLTPHIRSEVLRELPHPTIPGNREYEFTICVRSAAGREWDGVGTCSTFEAKYRWRKAERRCPACGKNTIIQGKAEFGGGWLCWKKKNGCGATFKENDPAITSQPGGQAENENPADYWNTVRKMAFKRALVHAAINATNTSELWSQDLEDLPRQEDEPPKSAPGRAGGGSTTAQTSKPAPTPKPATPAAAKEPAPKPEPAPKCATEQTRQWMIRELADHLEHAAEYFTALGQLLPTEGLADLPLRFVPVSREQMAMLKTRLAQFGNGERAEPAFPPNPEPLAGKAPKQAGAVAKAVTQTPAAAKKAAMEVPRDANLDPHSPEAAWRSFPVTFGSHAGVKLADLDKKVLFGFWANFTPEETWEDKDGNTRDTKPDKLAKDRKFREMLDQAGLHYGFTKPD